MWKFLFFLLYRLAFWSFIHEESFWIFFFFFHLSDYCVIGGLNMTFDVWGSRNYAYWYIRLLCFHHAIVIFCIASSLKLMPEGSNFIDFNFGFDTLCVNCYWTLDVSTPYMWTLFLVLTCGVLAHDMSVPDVSELCMSLSKPEPSVSPCQRWWHLKC